jgi:hypothetical protein
MSRTLTVALAQYPSGRDCKKIVADAKAAGAEIVVFPEMYSNGYARFDPKDDAARARWCAEAESLNGDFVSGFCEAAKARRLHVVVTFLEKAEPKPYNAALLIDPDGRPLLHHRKVHICDFDSPELACAPGSNFTPCNIEIRAGLVRLGLMICMDRETRRLPARCRAKEPRSHSCRTAVISPRIAQSATCASRRRAVALSRPLWGSPSPITPRRVAADTRSPPTLAAASSPRPTHQSGSCSRHSISPLSAECATRIGFAGTIDVK